MFIINRELNEFYKDDYEDLLNRVLIPIYPNERIRTFNAQIKARAIAGCVQDKRYYQQIGASNSGKGVETDLIKYYDFLNAVSLRSTIKRCYFFLAKVFQDYSETE